MKSEFEECISLLYKTKKWKKVIKLLNENCGNVNRRKLLWVVPTLSDISWIKDIIEENSLQGIISIGCGSGLFEWLIEQESGCEIIGIEVDRKWWQSKYSPPMFIKNITFADEIHKRIPLLTNYALLFCYFNNGDAFYNYMREYRGNIVMVVGPKEGENRHTNPMPFDHKFAELGWRLYKVREMKTSNDCISVFVKLRTKSMIN